MRSSVSEVPSHARQEAQASRRAFFSPGSRAERLSFFAWWRNIQAASTRTRTCPGQGCSIVALQLAPSPSLPRKIIRGERPLPRPAVDLKPRALCRERGKRFLGGKGAAEPPPSLRITLAPLRLISFRCFVGGMAERGARGVRPEHGLGRGRLPQGSCRGSPRTFLRGTRGVEISSLPSQHAVGPGRGASR